MRSLGADEVVDYLREDFTKSGQTYDATIDAVSKYSFRRGRRALKPGGVYVATDGGRFLLETLAMWVATRLVGSKRVRTAIGRRSKADVLLLKELIEGGEFRAVVDRRYPMDQVAEAHRYVETWQKTVKKESWQPAILLNCPLQPLLALPMEESANAAAKPQLFELKGIRQGEREYLDRLGLLKKSPDGFSTPSIVGEPSTTSRTASDYFAGCLGRRSSR